MAKVKEIILKAAREGNDIKLSHFSAETFQVLKEKNHNLGYSTHQGYHSELKEIKSFSDKQKLGEFINTKLI